MKYTTLLVLAAMAFVSCTKEVEQRSAVVPGETIAENTGFADYKCYVIETRLTGGSPTFQYFCDTDILLSVNGDYGTTSSPYDVNKDGEVDTQDILAMVGAFGTQSTVPYSLDDVVIDFDFNEGQSMCSIPSDPEVALAWFQRTPADELPNTPVDFNYTPKTFKLEVAKSGVTTTYWMKLGSWTSVVTPEAQAIINEYEQYK